MAINESGEMYLETILVLRERNGSVRSIDVANELDYSKPSVSRAMGILKEKGLVMIESGGNIILTPKGEETARDILDRHHYISQYLIQALNVSKHAAIDDACKIEHVISNESFKQIREWVKKNS
jgi:Mn-dependent DtxR family transcriptional regulator